ncbi:hypothetical protein [Thiovibrio frasassiensis]|uniref:Uncharacterized protein n=1 Tax=Thiovibrio frasassiensis TaxID=2984131 RepID=A0A9X4MFH8_9BACT|nr:hypothetical protein [Thiovibrio frasassiensis]MDG4475406.1 hypothetical protein [Thiovibrio frasassiensis]
MGKGIVVMEEEIKPLSSRERMLREELERRIISEFGAFHRVGTALAEINERQLYRETHRTFESYCKNLWDMARGTAYRYIAAAEVFENVSKLETNTDETMTLLPINEAQVRPLTRLKPEQQVAVWRSVVDTAGPGRKITASLVNKAVKGFLGERVVKAIRTAKAKVRLSPVSAEFIEVFEAFADQLIKEKESGYKYTPRVEIIKRLDQLRAEIAMDGEEIEGPAFHGGSDDTSKLLRAGYRLFRTDRSSMTVKEHGGTGWKKHSGPFDTIKAMDEELKTILQDEKHLRG